MRDTKRFPVGDVASIMTGKLCGDFSGMHELAEWLLGRPVWTHEFASRKLCARLKTAIIDQRPELMKMWNMSDDIVDERTARGAVSIYGERYGREIELSGGTMNEDQREREFEQSIKELEMQVGKEKIVIVETL